MPSLYCIFFRIECVQGPVTHLDALGINFYTIVDIFQGTVPSVSEVLAVGLGLPCSIEPEFLVRSSLAKVSPMSSSFIKAKFCLPQEGHCLCLSFLNTEPILQHFQ